MNPLMYADTLRTSNQLSKFLIDQHVAHSHKTSATRKVSTSDMALTTNAHRGVGARLGPVCDDEGSATIRVAEAERREMGG